MQHAPVLPYSLEWWHIILSIGTLAIGLGLKAFAGGFRAWADKLESFKNSIEARMEHMEKEFANRMATMESKFTQHESRVHNLTIHVERRVTWLEASLYRDGRLPSPPTLTNHSDPTE
jgi:hypothetical protein